MSSVRPWMSWGTYHVYCAAFPSWNPFQPFRGSKSFMKLPSISRGRIYFVSGRIDLVSVRVLYEGIVGGCFPRALAICARVTTEGVFQRVGCPRSCRPSYWDTDNLFKGTKPCLIKYSLSYFPFPISRPLYSSSFLQMALHAVSMLKSRIPA